MDRSVQNEHQAGGRDCPLWLSLRHVSYHFEGERLNFNPMQGQANRFFQVLIFPLVAGAVSTCKPCWSGRGAAGGRTLIPKNAFSWRVPHPMVLRVRVLTIFQPGAPGTQRREHSGVNTAA